MNSVISFLTLISVINIVKSFFITSIYIEPIKIKSIENPDPVYYEKNIFIEKLKQVEKKILILQKKISKYSKNYKLLKNEFNKKEKKYIKKLNLINKYIKCNLGHKNTSKKCIKIILTKK